MSFDNYAMADILIILSLLIVLILSALLVNMQYINSRMGGKILTERKTLRKQRRRLHKVDTELGKYKHQLKGGVSEKVIDEIEKINKLWKSKNERLYGGYWRKTKKTPDELEKLQERSKWIAELIKQTKIKYHKRDIDEESFREIVKEYQKELMELDLKVRVLKKNS